MTYLVKIIDERISAPRPYLVIVEAVTPGDAAQLAALALFRPELARIEPADMIRTIDLMEVFEMPTERRWAMERGEEKVA